jgi:ATP sulfurylase
VPITLAIGEVEAERFAAAGEAALLARDGRSVAVLEVSDVWRPDKELEAREVFGTTDPSHPGVAALLRAGPMYIGGEILAFDRAVAPAFPAHDLGPAEARARLAAKGWRRVAGFPTGGPIYRAEEHITKAALEICDGLLIHALVGEEGEIPAEARMRAHEELLARYYPADRALLSASPAAVRGAGPREALLRAIVCKNHGCSHFVVSRGEAREIFDEIAPAELGITPLCFDDAFYSTAASAMATARTAPGDGSARIHLSSDEIRARLRRGEALPPEVARPEVARILADAMRRGAG